MDLPAIGAWAGDKGPYLLVILALLRIIHQLITRLLAQQDVVLKAMQITEKSTEVAQKSTDVAQQVVVTK